MDNLKPCPFCGGEASLYKRRTSCRFYALCEDEIPPNGKLEHVTEYPDGRKVYVYSKNEWVAGCNDTSCIGRSYKAFPSEAAATKAWNRRGRKSNGSRKKQCGKGLSEAGQTV